MIKKILFVTRFEDLCFDAVQSILDLRRAGLENIVFLNVIDRDKVAMRRGTGYQKKEEIKLREMANIRFIDWAETLFEQGMEVGVYIVVGTLVQQVVQAVEKEGDIDLVVIGRQKSSRLQRFLSGPDTSEILHRTQKPLLVYKYLIQDGMVPDRPFQRPMLASGRLTPDQTPVAFLKQLGGVCREISVIHVASEKDLKENSAMAIQKTRKNVRQGLDTICDVFDARGIAARPHVYIGDPLAEIDKAARECQASMIVTGGPGGQGAWQQRWLTSCGCCPGRTERISHPARSLRRKLAPIR